MALHAHRSSAVHKLHSHPHVAPMLHSLGRQRGLSVIRGASGTPPPRMAADEGPDYSRPSRNLALELVRVTEAGALASGRWLGKGDKNAADQAAVDMMRTVLNSVAMDGVVVIGEGEKDEAPMLYCGERIGDRTGPQVDIAVDPLDGTTLTAQGRNGAISVIAVAARGSLFDPGPCMYMEKLAVGPEVPAHLVSLDYPVERNLVEVARALRKPVSDVTVIILDRPRHKELIDQIRAAGARIRMISDGDVAGAIEVAKAGGPVDILMGIGGTPEGVIAEELYRQARKKLWSAGRAYRTPAAAALKCMGGSIQGRLWPRSEDERKKAEAAGYDIKRILHTEDLCQGDDVFFAATGVSDSDLLKGVRYFSGGATTNSIVMRCKSGTVRIVETHHRWAKPSVTNPTTQEMTAPMHLSPEKIGNVDAEVAAAVAAAAAMRGVHHHSAYHGSETVLEHEARTAEVVTHTPLPLEVKPNAWR